MDEQTTWNIEYKWTQITNASVIAEVDTASLITPISTMDILKSSSFEYLSSSSLSIPAFGLEDDASYLFHVAASNGGDFEDGNTTASALVIVTAFDVAVRRAVYQQTVGTSSTLEVAVSDLFEFARGSPPDNGHYQYRWECVLVALPDNVTLSSADKNYVLEFGYNLTECTFDDGGDEGDGNVTRNGLFPMEDSRSFDLHFGAYSLTPQSVYILTLSIEDNNGYFERMENSVSLFIEPAELPAITILSTVSTMNPDDNAVVSVQVTPSDAVIAWLPTDASSTNLPADLYGVSWITIQDEEVDGVLVSNLILNPDLDLDVDTSKSCHDTLSTDFQRFERV